MQLRETGGCANNANCVDAIEPGVLAFLDLRDDEFVEAFRAGLFHAFEAEPNVYRKGQVELVMCVEKVDPTKDGTFVIGRTATIQTASLIISGQLERWEFPAIRQVSLERMVGNTYRV